MSKIILIYKNEELLDYFRTILSAQFDEEYVWASTINEGLTLLNQENNNINLILIDFKINQSDKAIGAIIKREKAIPTIVTANSEDMEQAKKAFKSQTLLDYFCTYESSELLWKKVDRMIGLSKRGQKEKKFCRVNLNFFYSTKEVFCDVYLRINDDKYIKVFNRYDEVDFMDLKKYDKRNIKYLFVRERDFNLITKKLVESLRPLNSDEHALELVQNDNLNMVFSIQLQETVSETIQKIGLNAEAVEMTSIAVNSTMSLISKDKGIYDILKNSIKGENYASEHSFLLSYISNAILKETELYNEDNVMILTLAAFFHDVTVEGPEDAKIQSQTEYRFKKLGISEQEEYLRHPMKAAELVDQIEGVPQQVITIIENHHERYDGTGFPQGIDYKRISPLSALFNVAHEICLYIYDSGQNPENIKSIIRSMQGEYTQGNYKVATEAALVAFSRNTPKVANSSTSDDVKKVS